MRRFFGPGLGLLLVGLVAIPAAAQRSSDPPPVVLEEPRPNPIFPAVLVPFTIAPNICGRGHTPNVTLRVYNALTTAVATLHLRDRPAAVLDSIPLRCGQYVAQWDGTIESGTRVAPPGIYHFRLSVDDRPRSVKMIVVTPP